jgi:hypothetical protein
MSDGMRLSKRYKADECYIAIEIKLNKMLDKQKMLVGCEKDMHKLENMRTRNPCLICFSLLLDKKNHNLIETERADLLNRYSHTRIIYANVSGNDFFI